MVYFTNLILEVSLGGNMVTDHRNRLGEDRIAESVLLHDWLALGNDPSDKDF